MAVLPCARQLLDAYSSKLAYMDDRPDAQTDEQIVTRALERCGGNARALARVLDVKPMRVYQWIRRSRLAVPWRLYLSALLSDTEWPPQDKLPPVRRGWNNEVR